MRVISLYPKFKNKGGAQNVCIQLSSKLNTNEVGIILTYTSKSDIPLEYTQNDAVRFEALSLTNIRKYVANDTIFLSHHRKTTTILMLIRALLGKKLQIVHIAHNTFTSLRWLSLFPKNIIAVSSGVKNNLIEYFRVSPSYIQIIHNGLADCSNRSQARGTKTQILLAGRLTRVKQQVEFVRHTKGYLSKDIRIDFAGEGEDREILEQTIENDSRYRCIGLIDVHKHLPNYDYVCLYSQKEGLPLSLIEGCMYGKPLITNDILPVLDVNTDKYNGFVFPTWDSLIKGLNHLPPRESLEYKRLSLNARTRYEDLFTETRMINQYREYLEHIIQNG